MKILHQRTPLLLLKILDPPLFTHLQSNSFTRTRALISAKHLSAVYNIFSMAMYLLISNVWFITIWRIWQDDETANWRNCIILCILSIKQLRGRPKCTETTNLMSVKKYAQLETEYYQPKKVCNWLGA